MRGAFALAALPVLAFVHCSSDPAPSTPADTDSGIDSDSGTSLTDSGVGPDSNFTSDAGSQKWTDVAAFDPSVAATAEAEPNNLVKPTEINVLPMPGRIAGAIDVADDEDIFSMAVNPGEFWSLRLVPDGTNLVPKSTVIDIAKGNLNPTRIVRGKDKSVSPRLIYFVLHSGQFVAAVQDARNTSSGSAHVGGAGFKYTMEVSKVTTQPKKATFPSTVQDALQYPGDLGVISFQGTKGFAFSIVLRAARKSTPSQLDSRISLYNKTTNTTVITNDNVSGSTDSEFSGNLAADGEYLLIVEDEGDHVTDPATPLDLSYEVEFKAK